MEQLKKIRICAELADFAYTAGNPERRDSSAVLRGTSRKLPEDFSPSFQDHKVINFQEYYSRSWNQSHQHQHRFFKAYAYLLHLRKQDDVDTIIVGLRGTFNHSTSAGRNFIENGVRDGQQPYCSRVINWLFDKFAPSNYGLADFYYDATLIRVPYRKGPVWKWYSYWAMLILGGTQWCPSFFAGPRRIAADWLARPYSEFPGQGTDGDARHLDQLKDGHVHLGFWSLWASPEGFAGYNNEGRLLNGDNDSCLLSHCKGAINKAKAHQRTEILVVGHSLGGAVSCFAALGIAAYLKEPGNSGNASLFHVTFGAPPVGTAEFAKFFNVEISPHESFAVFHEQDVVSQLFAFCDSKWYSRWIGWWNDWSRVGTKRPISKVLENQPDIGATIKLSDKCKWGVVLVGTLCFLMVSKLCVPFSWIWYLWHQKYYCEKENPKVDWKYNKGEHDRPIKKDVGLKYHSLKNYIKLLEHPDVFTVSDGAPAGNGAKRSWWKFWA
ncbi:hypothetical protein TruAng_011653 [Truncatella angustata]|nr:hypothetical protein TruAng_011653 [Truncatella angustata]